MYVKRNVVVLVYTFHSYLLSNSDESEEGEKKEKHIAPYIPGILSVL